MRDFHTIFVHGVGEQGPDFAAEARHNLRAACVERGARLYAASVHWAPLADKVERRFLSEVKRRGSKGNMAQDLVVGTLADAIMYARNPALREQIFYLVDEQIARLRGEHVVAICHSLGGLILTDWLRSRPSVKNVSLVTMGCNIGLFTLGQKFQPVPQLTARGSWLNVFSARDMLGFPLAGDPNLGHVQDVEVSLGGLFTGWTGLSHLRYWGDRKLFRKTLPKLLAI